MTAISANPITIPPTSSPSTRPYVIIKSLTVAQQLRHQKALRDGTNDLPQDSPVGLLRCKRRIDFARGCGRLDANGGTVARRNERERNRVKQVNMGFAALRDHVPNGRNNKKMSKVETLRGAMSYIKQLQSMLHANNGNDPNNYHSFNVSKSLQNSSNITENEENENTQNRQQSMYDNNKFVNQEYQKLHINDNNILSKNHCQNENNPLSLNIQQNYNNNIRILPKNFQNVKDSCYTLQTFPSDILKHNLIETESETETINTIQSAAMLPDEFHGRVSPSSDDLSPPASVTWSDSEQLSPEEEDLLDFVSWF